MRRVLLVGVFSVFSLFLAGPAAADTVQLFGRVEQSTDGNPALTVCNHAFSPGPMSVTCGGGLLVDRTAARVGWVDTILTAEGSIANGITLKSGTQLDVQRKNDGDPGTTFYHATATTTASTSDAVIVHAGTHFSGFLRFIFEVTGGITEFFDSSTADGFDPTVPGDFALASGSALMSIRGTGNASATLTGPTTVTLDVAMVYGFSQNLAISLFTTASASVLLSEGYRVNTDFLNTAVLINTLILDDNLQLIDGASIQSLAGIDYRIGSAPTTPVPAPEPSTLLLIAGGLAGLLSRRRLAR